MTPLKRCPFCGGEPTVTESRSEWVEVIYSTISCHTCKYWMNGSSSDTPGSLEGRWNRRRTDGLGNWIEGELAKLADSNMEVRTYWRWQALVECRKQMRKLLDGVGVQGRNAK